MHRLTNRFQDRQVDDFAEPLGQIWRLRLAALRLDEAAAADLARNQAATDQFLIGAADRLHRKFQIVGQPAMGRQPRTIGQAPVMDGTRELVGQRLICRPPDECGIGLPQCHDLLEIEISAIDNRNNAPSWYSDEK
jgi:hypothetical protein